MKGRLLVWVQFTALFALVEVPGSLSSTLTRTILSALCATVGVVVLVFAFRALRESVTVYPEPRNNVPFVTSSIYSVIRHPMYLGALSVGAGIVMVKWNIWSLLIWLILFIDLQLKYHYEDRLLMQKWPEASEYQAKVGALIPRLRR